MSNMKKIFVFAIVALFVSGVFGAKEAEAFKVVEESATRLNDTTLLYTITYEFGFLNAGVRMPVAAKRAVDGSDAGLALGYTFMQGENAVTRGLGYAIVLSDAKVVEDRYYVPAGEREQFTLVAIIQDPALVSGISVEVTALPYTLVRDNEEHYKLTQTQLSPYQTSALDLK